MAAGNTYVALATNTLGSVATTVTFSSISAAYTDLRLVANYKTAAAVNVQIRFNSDTGSNYSSTYLLGNGTAASSGRESNDTSSSIWYTNSTNFVVGKTDIMNYANTTTYKSLLSRSDDSAVFVMSRVGLWRSTSAINSITILNDGAQSFAVGSTFSLYGISAA